jgi:hypothetical protein
MTLFLTARVLLQISICGLIKVQISRSAFLRRGKSLLQKWRIWQITFAFTNLLARKGHISAIASNQITRRLDLLPA